MPANKFYSITVLVWPKDLFSSFIVKLSYARIRFWCEFQLNSFKACGFGCMYYQQLSEYHPLLTWSWKWFGETQITTHFPPASAIPSPWIFLGSLSFSILQVDGHNFPFGLQDSVMSTVIFSIKWLINFILVVRGLRCCAGFLSLWRVGTPLDCGAWASHCGGVFSWGRA